LASFTKDQSGWQWNPLLNLELIVMQSATERPMENRIVTKLKAEFSPAVLEVLNESYMHSVPAGSETHFKVTLVAPAFVGKRQVQRHQAVYGCLAEELQQGVHALALHTFTPEEWQAAGQVPASPQCLGGSKRDQ